MTIDLKLLKNILLWAMALSGVMFTVFGVMSIWTDFDDNSAKLALTALVVGVGSSMVRWGIGRLEDE